MEAHMRPTTLAVAVVALAAMACYDSSTGPVSPGISPGTPTHDALSQAASPPYDIDVSLRAPDNAPLADASGAIKFRQPADAAHVAVLHTQVRGLEPGAIYQLQRAADPFDGNCTSTAWLTLGSLAEPLSITTNPAGNGQAKFTRDLTASLGKSFDIRFRVIDQTTKAVVL